MIQARMLKAILLGTSFRLKTIGLISCKIHSNYQPFAWSECVTQHLSHIHLFSSNLLFYTGTLFAGFSLQFLPSVSATLYRPVCSIHILCEICQISQRLYTSMNLFIYWQDACFFIIMNYSKRSNFTFVTICEVRSITFCTMYINNMLTYPTNEIIPVYSHTVQTWRFAQYSQVHRAFTSKAEPLFLLSILWHRVAKYRNWCSG